MGTFSRDYSSKNILPETHQRQKLYKSWWWCCQSQGRWGRAWRHWLQRGKADAWQRTGILQLSEREICWAGVPKKEPVCFAFLQSPSRNFSFPSEVTFAGTPLRSSANSECWECNTRNINTCVVDWTVGHGRRGLGKQTLTWPTVKIRSTAAWKEASRLSDLKFQYLTWIQATEGYERWERARPAIRGARARVPAIILTSCGIGKLT